MIIIKSAAILLLLATLTLGSTNFHFTNATIHVAGVDYTKALGITSHIPNIMDMIGIAGVVLKDSPTPSAQVSSLSANGPTKHTQRRLGA